VNRVAMLNLAALGLIALVAGGLGGCGRAGPLEPPPGSAAGAKPTEDAEANANAGVPQARPKPKPIQPPKQPFVLDPLL
jgi:predicted small lipoprotein YifL